MRQGKGLRVVQASPADPLIAIEAAWIFGCEAIAWDLREDCTEAVAAAKSARLRSEGWYSLARDPGAAERHPEWMHAPQHDAWLAGASVEGAQVVAPYIGLNNREAAHYAKAKLLEAILDNAWCSKLWLGDLQGPPMGCGCGNPSCRSWDNSPGPKLVDQSPYDLPDQFFSEKLFESIMVSIWDLDRPLQVSPVLCAECERGIEIGGIYDPDGPNGTNLCHGMRCGDPCAHDYWPELLARFRGWGGSLFVPQIGLLLACDALGKNHPVYGEPRRWPVIAHAHYGADLFPCVEAADAHRFESCLILLAARQDCWPAPAPAGYESSLRSVNV